jgi:hypothetical protein
MRTVGFGLLSLLLAVGPALGQEQAVDVKIGKYRDLTDLVQKNKGKVVLVDFWFTT